ncbi:MAG: hypothetical protein H6Q33_944 [Deltaproteobacteria bacterium]|nr:hypothetical protein [Deltaproteobacteria bacterium]
MTRRRPGAVVTLCALTKPASMCAEAVSASEAQFAPPLNVALMPLRVSAYVPEPDPKQSETSRRYEPAWRSSISMRPSQVPPPFNGVPFGPNTCIFTKVVPEIPTPSIATASSDATLNWNWWTAPASR